MTSNQEFATIAKSLADADFEVLVMGGHAVRYYGVDRNTNDFDFDTSLATPEELRTRFSGVTALSGIRPEPVCPHLDFARFEIGRLADGREEWLEFWIRNHLLADFAILKARSEVGMYGGRPVSFLSLPELIKSKERERKSAWLDIALLEEIHDARNFSQLDGTPRTLQNALQNVRSRRGDWIAWCRRPNLTTSIRLRRHKSLLSHLATFAFLHPLVRDIKPNNSKTCYRCLDLLLSRPINILRSLRSFAGRTSGELWNGIA